MLNDTQPNARLFIEDSKIHTTVGKPVTVMEGGLQPFLFCTDQGTLIAQVQVPEKPYRDRDRMTFAWRLAFAVSRDGGRSWDPFVCRPGQDEVNSEGGMVQFADGTIFALDTYVTPSEKKGFGIGEVWTSSDDWRTVKGPKQVSFELPRIDFDASSDDGGHTHRAARLHRSIVEQPNGDLLTTMYAWFDEDKAPSAYMPTMMKTRALLLRSTDRGNTWKYQSTIAADSGVGTEGFTEPVLMRISSGELNGRLVCIMRTGRDLYEAHSDDDGSTWSIYTPVDFPGIDIRKTRDWEEMFAEIDDPAPHHYPSLVGGFVDPDVIEMKNGLVVCAFGLRIPEKLCWANPAFPLNGNFLAFSKDQGSTWTHIVQITSGIMTTHYMAVREHNPNELCVLYDLGAWGKPGRRTCAISIEVDY
jgi:hypothetical protein